MGPKARRRARRLSALASAEESVPITFAVVGVQKAATTTLYQTLTHHPQIVSGPQKEMRYFIEEEQDWSAPDYSTYRRPLLSGGEVAGDATPAYLFWPHALERMRAYHPGMRLIASFRDPIERAFSQWGMERSRHPLWYPDLPHSIELYGDDPVPTEIPDGPISRFLQLAVFARGLYGEQLERGMSLFPPEQWLMFEFRQLLEDMSAHLDRTTDHLGLSRFTTYPPDRHSNRTRPQAGGPAPSVAAVEHLVERYRPDLELFERLSQVDTDSWPTRQVIDGRLDVADLHARLCSKLGLRAD
jgi:hypothetical protein